jgi:hypothetical protein
VSVFRGHPAEVEGWLARAEAADGDDVEMSGGVGSVTAAVSLVRAGLADGDVGKQVSAGRRAVQREYDDPMWGWIADGCLGIALFWAGELEESRMRIERVAGRLEDVGLPQAASLGHAYLAMIEFEAGGATPDRRQHLELALSLVRAHHLDDQTDTGVVYLARGKQATAPRGGS